MIEEETIQNAMMKIFKLPVDTNFSSLDMDSCDAWDSLAHMKLIIELENSLGVTFSEVEIETALSFSLLTEIIEGK